MPSRLERSQTNRMVAGVCGGIGEYLQIDAILVRAFFVLLAIAGGIGVLLYIVLLLIMPLPGRAAPIGPGNATLAAGDRSATVPLGRAAPGDPVAVAPADHERRRSAVGVFLVIVGALFLLGNFGVFRFVDWRYIWPLVIIAFGVLLLVQRTTRR